MNVIFIWMVCDVFTEEYCVDDNRLSEVHLIYCLWLYVLFSPFNLWRCWRMRVWIMDLVWGEDFFVLQGTSSSCNFECFSLFPSPPSQVSSWPQPSKEMMSQQIQVLFSYGVHRLRTPTFALRRWHHLASQPASQPSLLLRIADSHTMLEIDLIWFNLLYLLTDISSFMSYLILKLSLSKNSRDTI